MPRVRKRWRRALVEGFGYGVNEDGGNRGARRNIDRRGDAIPTFEAAHRSVSSLDPAMVLFDPIIQILVRPVFHAFVQFGPIARG